MKPNFELFKILFHIEHWIKKFVKRLKRPQPGHKFDMTGLCV